MTAPGPALTAADLYVRAGGRAVLDGVGLNVAPGEALAVAGPSGSGKTTLLLVLAGLLAPDRGTVRLGEDRVEPESRARDRIALVLQTFGLAPALTAAENVALPLQVRRVDREAVRARAVGLLDRLGLEPATDRAVGELSGGQQQRVAVARALAVQAPVLLADEPTSQLDAENRALVLSLIEEERARGAIVVVASHDPDVVAACPSHLDLLDGHVRSLARTHAREPT